MDEDSVELFARLRVGDDPAADEVFRRYMSRLTVLARTRLSPRLAQRLDPEDVVLSAFRSFFVRTRDGEFSLTRSGDLWRLLAAITLHKLHRQAERHQAERRSFAREERLEDSNVVPSQNEPFSRRPTAEEAVALADELEHVMSALPPIQRRVLELRLQDHTLDEIAAAVGRNERTVRRTLEEIHAILQRRLYPDRAEVSKQPVQFVDDVVEANDTSTNKQTKGRTNAPQVSHEFDPRAPLTHHDFLLQTHLGSGGMGRVYRAVQKSPNKTVAVKVLKKSRQRDPAAVERFLDEARIVARLQHPRIVGVHGLGRMPSGGHFLVMDYVAGADLSRIGSQRQITVAEAVSWVASAAEAIAYAHSQGIVHCDLKPANLLLDANCEVHITDFGFAKSLAVDQSSTLFGGTLGYMAPEQIAGHGEDISPRTDVYGLGALLYGLLAGRPPFVGTSVSDVFRRILSTIAAPLIEFRSDIPAELNGVIERCLMKLPEQRLETASDVATALRSITP